MDNKEFAKSLELRTKKFGVSVLKLSAQLPNSQEAKVIRNQISKSGTCVGANYREANRSRSKPDFANKVKIAEGEASETIYWLEIIQEMEWITESKLVDIMKEANEILAIFTSISKNLK